MRGSFSGRATQGSFFEGLFIHSLQASGDFAAALRDCGFDPYQLRTIYPIEVWNAALEVAWHHRYPALDRESAYRELGRQLALGFLKTWMGKVVNMGLPILGPDRLIARIPSLVGLDTYRYDVKVVQVSWRHYRVSFRNDPDAKPDLMAGLFEAGLGRANVKATAEVTMRAARDFDIDLRW